MSTLSVNLPNSLHRKLEELARQEGVAVEQFVAIAVAEKLSALATEEYLEARAERGSRERYERALAQIPNAEPEARDRIG